MESMSLIGKGSVCETLSISCSPGVAMLCWEGKDVTNGLLSKLYLNIYETATRKTW